AQEAAQRALGGGVARRLAQALGEAAHPLHELEERLPLQLTQHVAQRGGEEVDVGAQQLELARVHLATSRASHPLTPRRGSPPTVAPGRRPRGGRPAPSPQRLAWGAPPPASSPAGAAR